MKARLKPSSSLVNHPVIKKEGTKTGERANKPMYVGL